MSFDLFIQTEEVIITEVQQGKEIFLIHRVRRPKTSEYIKYQGKLTQVTGTRKVSFEFRRVQAALWLYREIIQDVQGYTYKGKPIKEVTPEDIREFASLTGEDGINDWIDMIPAPHKVEVVEKVVRAMTLAEMEVGSELGESSS